MSRRADLIFKKLEEWKENEKKENEDDASRPKTKSNSPNKIFVQKDLHLFPAGTTVVNEQAQKPVTVKNFENVGLTADSGSTNILNPRALPHENNQNDLFCNSSSQPYFLEPNSSKPNADPTSPFQLSPIEHDVFEDSNLINENTIVGQDNTCIDLNNEPLLFIINDNGEMIPIPTSIENQINHHELSINNELNRILLNGIDEIVIESNSRETQTSQGTVEIMNQSEHSEIIEEISNNHPFVAELDNTNNDLILSNQNDEIGIETDSNEMHQSQMGEAEFTNQSEHNHVIEDNSTNTPTVADINNTNAEKEHEAELNVKRTRRKRRQVKEDEWEYKRAKILREKGEQYKGRKLMDGKSKFLIDKPKKDMKPISCKCKLPNFSCSVLSEDDRKHQFKKFWNMTWQEKRIYVSALTEIDLTSRARDRKEENVSRRKFSYRFYLSINKKKMRVCRQTFLATFDLKGWTVNNWLKEKMDNGNEDNLESDEDIEKEDDTENEKVGKSNNKRKAGKPSRQEQLISKQNSLKEFLLTLPTVESHHCRKSSTKLYLEPVWASKREIYEHYCKEWCKEKGIEPLSQCSFHKAFEDLNLAIYQPKKDQCDLCRAYVLKHISEDVYQNHRKKKDDAQKEKEKDKIEETNVFTVDLQSLLLCPKSMASALYYRRKLAVHNFCIFNLRSKEGFCFLWNESEGKLTANEFSSILYYFLENQILSGSGSDTSKKFIIYSDGCTYQNRCATLSNALLHLAVKHKVTIQQKFLEKGHTYMECDAMHSTIERHLKNKDINVPADYITICKNARKHPKPYNVKYLDYSFFKDFNKEIVYKSIRPGEKTGDPKVTDIRCLQYSAEGKISYKLNYEDNYEDLQFEITTLRKSARKSSKLNDDAIKIDNVGHFNFPQLYKTRQKIPQEKFKHLQELKSSVPKDFHVYYDNLPTEL